VAPALREATQGKGWKMNAVFHAMLFDLKSPDVVRVIEDVDASSENKEPEMQK